MFTKFFLNLALRTMSSRTPDFVIGDPERPYLLRWWLLPRNHFFNIYIHKFLRNDDDRALHDHPWPSLSFLVRGLLLEHYTSPNGAYPRKRYITVGEWTYRSAKFAHRLAIPMQDDRPITVFMTGPRIREWGFHCPQGWKHWKDFVGLNKGTIGVGCGEQDEPQHRCELCNSINEYNDPATGYCAECFFAKLGEENK